MMMKRIVQTSFRKFSTQEGNINKKNLKKIQPSKDQIDMQTHY